MQKPAVWGKTSYDHRFFQVGWGEMSTMVTLYEVFSYRDRDGFRDAGSVGTMRGHTYSIAITTIPAHLASGAFYLLGGKSGDDLIRLVMLPKKGPPEIKYLRVTLNQILDEWATRSAKSQRAHRESKGWTIEEDACDIGSEEVPVSVDEDELDSELDESSATRSEVSALSADNDRPAVSESEESSDTDSEVAAISADSDRPAVSESEESSDTDSEVAAMSADNDRLGGSDSEEGSDMG